MKIWQDKEEKSDNNIKLDLSLTTTSSISMWFERWFLSSNAKDIGVLYLIYALFSGLVGTAFSVLIRLELSGPGVQFIADNQLYNSIITAHAIIMIFFMVMPALIGGFGNFLLPLGLGGPDMGFPRLNNISYLSLIPSIVLFLFAGGIENGVGTGWTLYMEYSEQMTGLVLFRNLSNVRSALTGIGESKLFSIRRHPLLFNGLSYSWLFKSYGRTLMTGGQFVWVANSQKEKLVTYQRLSGEYCLKKSKFEEWLVGMTVGSGTFGFYKKHNQWVLCYKIVLSRSELKSLYVIKTKLGTGIITKNNNKAQIVIKDNKKLNDTIIPIFNKYPFLLPGLSVLNKYSLVLPRKFFYYAKFIEANNILLNSALDNLKKEKLLLELRKGYMDKKYKSVFDIQSPFFYKRVVIIHAMPWFIGYIQGISRFSSGVHDYTGPLDESVLNQHFNEKILHDIRVHNSTPIVIVNEKKYRVFILDISKHRAVEETRLLLEWL